MRRTSLDELPQLINVLNGDMSLVGPRPERTEYVEVYEKQVPRLRGAAPRQVGGHRVGASQRAPGTTSLADRAEWDNYYIENWSLWLDFKIMPLDAGRTCSLGARRGCAAGGDDR